MSEGNYGYGDTDEDDAIDEFRVHEGIILAVHLTNTINGSLSSIFTTFLNLLITLTKTMPNTGLGLYIFNCAKDNKNEPGMDTPEGVYRIFRLQDLNQGMLKILDRYLQNAIPKDTVIDISFNNNEKWNKLLPIKDTNVDESFGSSLYSMLQQALMDFNNIPMRTEEYTSRKIFLFTDCATPFHGDQNLKQKIHSKLRDLNDFKITVYPFILKNTETDSFTQINEFRQLFDFPLESDLDSKKYLPAINEVTLDKLDEKIIKHATVRRMAFQCPLIFGDLKISVRGINPFTRVEWKKIQFYNNNNRLSFVTKKHIPTCAVDGQELEPEDIKRVYQIADQYIGIDEQISTECLKFGEPEKPILHVVGTRKFEYFNPSYTISKSLFMIADDDSEVEDSLQQFAALYKSLCKKKMMVLCWGMPRKSSYPRFYYLIPTSIIDTFGLTFEKYPQALAMLEIPFGNEVRKAPDYINELENLHELDDTKMMDQLVKSAMVEKFQTLPNPSLSWKFKVMEDHILQREVSSVKGENEDFGKQQLEMDEMYQQLASLKLRMEKDDTLTQLVHNLQSRYNRVLNFNELKRNAEDQEANKIARLTSKRVKLPSSKETMTDARAVIFYNEFGLKNCTNDVLRDYIKSKGGLIARGKNKTEMIENIVDYLTNNRLI